MLDILEKEKNTHLEILGSIQRANSYEIVELALGYAKIVLNLSNVQTLDNSTTVFEAEIFKVANFCALAAVNSENSFVISANVDFLSQVEISSNEVVFEAKSLSSSLGKKFVEVKGMIDDITVFIGDFTVLKLDNRSKIKV
jgi:acyl-coenzyme A thioesterase PaaI-like protein